MGSRGVDYFYMIVLYEAYRIYGFGVRQAEENDVCGVDVFFPLIYIVALLRIYQEKL